MEIRKEKVQKMSYSITHIFINQQKQKLSENF